MFFFSSFCVRFFFLEFLLNQLFQQYFLGFFRIM